MVCARKSASHFRRQFLIPVTGACIKKTKRCPVSYKSMATLKLDGCKFVDCSVLWIKGFPIKNIIFICFHLSKQFFPQSENVNYSTPWRQSHFWEIFQPNFNKLKHGRPLVFCSYFTYFFKQFFTYFFILSKLFSQTISWSTIIDANY